MFFFLFLYLFVCLVLEPIYVSYRFAATSSCAQQDWNYSRKSFGKLSHYFTIQSFNLPARTSHTKPLPINPLIRTNSYSLVDLKVRFLLVVVFIAFCNSILSSNFNIHFGSLYKISWFYAVWQYF